MKINLVLYVKRHDTGIIAYQVNVVVCYVDARCKTHTVRGHLLDLFSLSSQVGCLEPNEEKDRTSHVHIMYMYMTHVWLQFY